LSAYLGTEATQKQFIERKHKLEDELDRQLRVREKLDIQLSESKLKFAALTRGISASHQFVLGAVKYIGYWLQCFDAVGWVAGRASGL